jgi:hypothetical protein
MHTCPSARSGVAEARKQARKSVCLFWAGNQKSNVLCAAFYWPSRGRSALALTLFDIDFLFLHFCESDWHPHGPRLPLIAATRREGSASLRVKRGTLQRIRPETLYSFFRL